ncbi:MAG TPA: type II toxin-antitoxin system prevent-host-death family antitoxin [Casimicrobiaceae bacterium]|nr:type II toxin-antitoxin system prevent-host-death family antitoxin [Casimicrobiaceae bacterium]
MKRATISEAKNQLSALIRRVRRGEEVLILDRDVPVARLIPVQALEQRDDDKVLADLERRGIIRRPKRPPDPGLLDRLGPPPKIKGDILEALLADREEGR